MSTLVVEIGRRYASDRSVGIVRPPSAWKNYSDSECGGRVSEQVVAVRGDEGVIVVADGGVALIGAGAAA